MLAPLATLKRTARFVFLQLLQIQQARGAAIEASAGLRPGQRAWWHVACFRILSPAGRADRVTQTRRCSFGHGGCAENGYELANLSMLNCLLIPRGSSKTYELRARSQKSSFCRPHAAVTLATHTSDPMLQLSLDLLESGEPSALRGQGLLQHLVHAEGGHGSSCDQGHV
jgi:hypothetical protein